MTLLDAQPYDPAKARRRKIQIAATVAVVIVMAALAWMYRNWPEEHCVDKFFAALEHQHYEALTAFTSTIPAGFSTARSIPNTPTRTSIAIGDRAASGA